MKKRAGHVHVWGEWQQVPNIPVRQTFHRHCETDGCKARQWRHGQRVSRVIPR